MSSPPAALLGTAGPASAGLNLPLSVLPSAPVPSCGSCLLPPVPVPSVAAHTRVGSTAWQEDGVGFRCWHGGSALCFLLFALLFLGQSCRLLSGLLLAVRVALWLTAAATRVVQSEGSLFSCQCLLPAGFPCLPLLKPRDYDVGQLPKGVRAPKDIKKLWAPGMRLRLRPSPTLFPGTVAATGG